MSIQAPAYTDVRPRRQSVRSDRNATYPLVEPTLGVLLPRHPVVGVGSEGQDAIRQVGPNAHPTANLHLSQSGDDLSPFSPAVVDEIPTAIITDTPQMHLVVVGRSDDVARALPDLTKQFDRKNGGGRERVMITLEWGPSTVPLAGPVVRFRLTQRPLVRPADAQSSIALAAELIRLGACQDLLRFAHRVRPASAVTLTFATAWLPRLSVQKALGRLLAADLARGLECPRPTGKRPDVSLFHACHPPSLDKRLRPQISRELDETVKAMTDDPGLMELPAFDTDAHSGQAEALETVRQWRHEIQTAMQQVLAARPGAWSQLHAAEEITRQSARQVVSIHTAVTRRKTTLTARRKQAADLVHEQAQRLRNPPPAWGPLRWLIVYLWNRRLRRTLSDFARIRIDELVAHYQTLALAGVRDALLETASRLAGLRHDAPNAERQLRAILRPSQPFFLAVHDERTIKTALSEKGRTLTRAHGRPLTEVLWRGVATELSSVDGDGSGWALARRKGEALAHALPDASCSVARACRGLLPSYRLQTLEAMLLRYTRPPVATGESGPWAKTTIWLAKDPHTDDVRLPALISLRWRPETPCSVLHEPRMPDVP